MSFKVPTKPSHSRTLRAFPQHCPGARAAAPPVAGQVLADFLLVVPEQAVQGQHVAVADEGQAVVDGVSGRAVGGNVKEEPAVQSQEQTSAWGGEQRAGGHWGLSLHTAPLGAGHGPYLRAASKLLFTKSLKGRMCSSFVNSTWLAIL